MEYRFKVDGNFHSKKAVDGGFKGVWVTYKRFIENMRSKLASGRCSHNRPVLPPQQRDEPIDRFHVVLETESHEIRLMIRRGNLYLDGYQMENSAQWLMFGSGSEPNLLGFGGSYGDLEGAAGPGQSVANINLGQDQLTTAVNELATTTDRQKRAKQLIVVIQMICEPIRFINISDHLTHNSGFRPPDWMIALEHGWGHLSNALLHEDADPSRPFQLPQPNAMGIRIAEEAVRVIGILLSPIHGRASRIRRMASLEAEGDNMALTQGRPMVEVFWVRIDNIDGENPGDLYGTITVADGLGSQRIYDRQQNDYQTFYPGDKILLTGPDRAISALDSFNMELHLFDKDDVTWDDEVSNGEITWNVFDNANVYDTILYGDVKGKYGSARVCYTVLSDAVEATITVYLINGDGESPADVYGEIAASYSHYNSEGHQTQLFGKKKDEYNIIGDGENPADVYEEIDVSYSYYNSDGQTLLFGKKEDEYINVRPGQPIGLAKKTVAVPTDYALSVRAQLYDHDTITPDDEIAKGIAVFPPLFHGTSEKNITGNYGEIRVKVTWNQSWGN